MAGRTGSWTRVVAFFGMALAVGWATAYRLTDLAGARHPGHADAAFYYSVARNLRAGRGPVIDYVWQFLVPHDGPQPRGCIG